MFNLIEFYIFYLIQNKKIVFLHYFSPIQCVKNYSQEAEIILNFVKHIFNYFSSLKQNLLMTFYPPPYLQKPLKWNLLVSFFNVKNYSQKAEMILNFVKYLYVLNGTFQLLFSPLQQYRLVSFCFFQLRITSLIEPHSYFFFSILKIIRKNWKWF